MLWTRLSAAGTDDVIVMARNAPGQIRLKPGREIELGWDCRALDAAWRTTTNQLGEQG